MIGRTLSQFKITAKLGEGGMGEVYRAEDTRLGREVAIKVLPEAVAGDPERLARFEREARVLAALDHAHIAVIFGLEEADGRKLLVMQLAEGETLAERIDRGPIPVEEALPIALQIAEALEAAHEKGIIHRDLKPANVQVTEDGQVKVLDFGLAKALESDDADLLAPDLTRSPTLIGGMTSEGLLLGTAAYMSPEQARGVPVDRRADIWAFGVLLLEMLSGESPFAAETAADTLAAVLTREVELRDLPFDTPPNVRWLLDRCLERDPKLRLRDVGEARVCLTTGAFPVPEPERTEPARGWRPGLVAAAIAATAGIVGLLFGLWMEPGSSPPGLRKVDIVLPDQFLFFQARPQLAPDGSAVLFSSEKGLSVRRLDRVESRLIPGTAGILYSTWAPNSREIAFVTSGRLWRTALDGQSPVAIATLPLELRGAGGMVWTPDDRILLAGSAASGLMEVSARGGTVRDSVPLDPETERDFHEISILPESRGFLISVHPTGGIPSRIDVLSEGERHTVLDFEEGWVETPVYSPPGYILFSRGNASAPGLWAAPFSLADLRATGDPFLVAPTGSTPSVSKDGTLSYVRGRRVPLRQPLEVDQDGRIGRELARPVPGGRYPAISPDGKRLVASVIDGETYDLMLFDVGTQTATRLTSGPGVDSAPAWAPDGGRIAYSISDRDQIAVVAIDRPGEPHTLTSGYAPRWLPDGESLLFMRLGEDASWEIWRYWLREEREEPLLTGAANQRWPIASPDGRWMAYTSDETGREELFVREFPEGERIQVSSRGATEPRWTSSGGLLFRSGSGIYSLRRVGSERLAFAEPKLLLSLTDNGLSSGEGDYDATADGGLVVLRNVASEDAAVLTLVTNWSSEFGPDR